MPSFTKLLRAAAVAACLPVTAGLGGCSIPLGTIGSLNPGHSNKTDAPLAAPDAAGAARPQAVPPIAPAAGPGQN